MSSIGIGIGMNHQPGIGMAVSVEHYLVPVKLTFTQLEGESIAAISVPLEAILKLEKGQSRSVKFVR